MPKRDDDLLVSDMVECSRKILSYVKNMNFDAFIDDDRTVDAVIRNFEVLGEASRYVSLEIKEKNPFVEWRKIGDFRNILIHDYFGINYETMWKIIKEELSDQLEFLEQVNTNIKD
jgi:uncharacterized protein with HEPN domain